MTPEVRYRKGTDRGKPSNEEIGGKRSPVVRVGLRHSVVPIYSGILLMCSVEGLFREGTFMTKFGIIPLEKTKEGQNRKETVQ